MNNDSGNSYIKHSIEIRDDHDNLPEMKDKICSEVQSLAEVVKSENIERMHILQTEHKILEQIDLKNKEFDLKVKDEISKNSEDFASCEMKLREAQDGGEKDEIKKILNELLK
jgi:hypothetical protein